MTDVLIKSGNLSRDRYAQRADNMKIFREKMAI